MAQGTTKGVPIDIDPLLAADSDLLVPSQKAVKTYITANAVSFTSLSATSPLSYNNAGVFSILQASGSTNGYLSSTDWTTFSNKQNALSGSGIVKSTAGTISYLTDNTANWDTAYTDRLKWDGGATGLTASTGRTSLGATTVGSNLFTLTNPSAITFPRMNADNSVSALNAADFRAAIGAGYGINFGATQSTFAANTTYYLGMVGAGIATNAAQRRVYIPASGTVKQVYIYVRTTNGTAAETWTMTFRLNNTSNTTIGSTATTSTDKVFSNSNLNVSVVAGDYFEITTTAPATAPGVSNLYGTLIIR